MAATFLQALVEAYEQIRNVPELWGEQIAESVVDYPRAELNHLGEVPTWTKDGITSQQFEGGTPERLDARVQIVLYANGLEEVDNLASLVKVGLYPTCLNIDNVQARLWRTNYTVGKSLERSTDQQPIFQAVIEFLCEIQGDYAWQS